jgi:hypothetical protein
MDSAHYTPFKNITYMQTDMLQRIWRKFQRHVRCNAVCKPTRRHMGEQLADSTLPIQKHEI